MASSPRVNGAMLASHTGSRMVRLCGRVESIDHANRLVHILTSDSHRVIADSQHATQDITESVQPNMVVELVCAVIDGQRVHAYHATDFGQNFDLDLYEEFLKLSHDRFRSIFM